jgi:hypothetical protein
MTKGGGKCLVTGAGHPVTTNQLGYLGCGVTIATSPEYPIPNVTGKLYLSF